MSLFARVVFVLLVAATFSAFFAAQRLKSTPPVATIQKLTLHFSPNGDGRRDDARLRVRVRKDDDVTIAVVDDAGTEVRRLAAAVPAEEERALRVSWDGRTATGATAPEGEYRLRVSLRRGGRAVTLNPGFALDVTAPRPTVLVGGPDGTKWITGPRASRVPFRVRVVSKRSPTRMSVLRTDLAAIRARSPRSRSRPECARASGTGAPAERPLRPARTRSSPRCATRPATSAARRPTGRVRCAGSPV